MIYLFIILLSLAVIGYQYTFMDIKQKQIEQTQIETQVVREAGIEKSLDIFVQSTPDLPVNTYELLADNYISLKTLVPLYGGRVASGEEAKLIQNYYKCLNDIFDYSKANNLPINVAIDQLRTNYPQVCNHFDFTGKNNYLPIIHFTNLKVETNIDRNAKNNKQVESIRQTYRQNYLEGSDKVMSLAMLKRQSDDKLRTKHHYVRIHGLTYDQARAILKDKDIIHMDYNTFKQKFNDNKEEIIDIANVIVENTYLARQKAIRNISDVSAETNIINAKTDELRQIFGVYEL